jgi:arabinofuranosyltransferase
VSPIRPSPYGPLTPVERWALVVALALAGALMAPIAHYVTDDTYIHLQYARHLAAGEGLVFNAGERVYGCTSPLWVALLADFIALGVDGMVASKLMGITAALASIVLFLQLMRRTVRTPEIRAAATVAWASHAWMARWAVSGMETPLAVAFVLAGFVAFTEGQQWGARPVRTGTLWSLAALTRPEGGLLLGLWGMFLIVDTNSRAGARRLIFGSLPPIAIFGSWLLFAKVYFGDMFPNTLAAKSAGAIGLDHRLGVMWREVQILGLTDAVVIVMLIAALLFGGRALWPGRVRAQRLVPWAWLLLLPALYVSRGVTVISRYLVPLMPVLAWLAWRTAECARLGAADPDPRQRARLGRAAAVVAGLIVAQNVLVWWLLIVPQVHAFTAGLEQGLARWGRWMAVNAPPGTLVATPDIGAIGWYSQHRVLDLAGLVTREMVPILAERPLEDAVARFDFVSFARPDLIVDRAEARWDLLARSPYAAALDTIGATTVPTLGIARPGATTYSVYRVHWARYDSLRASPQGLPATR